MYPHLRELRLTTCRPGRTALSGAVRHAGRLDEDGDLIRYTPSAARQAARIRALEGREPVPVEYQGSYDPGPSRANPRGRPVITITRVR